jgi:PAS domain S-box-containing protein
MAAEMNSMGPETMAGLGPGQAGLPIASPALLVPMMRGFLWVGAMSLLAGAGLMLISVLTHGSGALQAGLYFFLCLVCAGSTRLPARWLPVALTGLSSLGTLTMGINAITMGWGMSSVSLMIPGLLVCLLCVTANWKAGLMFAALALASLLNVAWWSLHTPGRDGPLLALQFGSNIIILAIGLASGLMISRVMLRYVRAAYDREERFRRLLALAADAYWELDADCRLVAATSQSTDLRPLTPAQGLGQLPWDLPQFAWEAVVLDELRADLDQRQPFRDVPLRWTVKSGSTSTNRAPATTRDCLLSGEPRFNSRGVFTGYWGVARDITAAKQAAAALAATEVRYRELFSRIPTPLVLHRSGTVLEANPSALALFGAPGEAAMVGRDLLSFYASGDSRERARRRMEMLHGQPLGTALPVSDFKLRLAAGEVAVRATGVRVDAAGGPAVLSIFVDDTERLAAEESVRRSEAMLSHLVATSPDLIALTEIGSGRYVMVNRAFERISGWRSDEAIGRTSSELGIWTHPSARDEFVHKLSEAGAVNDMPVSFTGKQGQQFLLIVSAARFVMDRRDYMVVNARDVTERERERMEREAILFNASIGIAVTRAQRFVLCNRHFENMYGWGAGELLGQPGTVVWPSDADYAQVAVLAGPSLARGEPIEFERPGRRKDGSAFTARVRGRAIDPKNPSQGGTVWIIEDITERRQAEQALARARDDAEAANRAKSAFLANTSHELRTPLNGMIGLAGLARAEDLAPALRRQYLDQIAQSAQSLAGIISDILDLSKIEAGKLQLETARFYLADELRTLCNTYGMLAVAKHITLSVHIAPEVEGAVMGDALRVRQIVSNFLANAVKFTATGGVQMRVSRLANAAVSDASGAPPLVRIEVQDTGAGIDDGTHDLLFKPFSQADQSTTRRYGGTGLGLSICQELASLMGGEVGVQSQLGQGSVFWAQLPLPAATTSPAAPPAAAEMHSHALQGKHVLMVEDNAVNMMIAVAMLERWGVVVAQAHNGQEAVTLVQQEAAAGRAFDAVLMDVHMPVMSGYEATLALRSLARAHAGGRHLPIIALTAAALVTEREAALQVGMDAFLTKPIDADKLRSTLLHWCATEQVKTATAHSAVG